MKWFLFLFGFYLLSLTAVPCSDSRDTHEPAGSSITTRQQHSNQEHAKEHCTPLCLCNCCSTVIAKIPLPPAIHAKTPLQGAFKSTVYSDEHLPGYHTNIWQPPKQNA